MVTIQNYRLFNRIQSLMIILNIFHIAVIIDENTSVTNYHKMNCLAQKIYSTLLLDLVLFQYLKV